MHLLALYLVACALVAWAGRKRRIGFLGFFLVSVFFSPIISLLIVMLSAPAKPESAY